MIQIESRHELAFPREAVWPILSKTDWLNRALRIPPVAYEVQPRPEGGSWVTARARILGRELRWRELPFEWLEPEYYHVRRIFETGPFTEGTMGMTLEALPGNRTRVVFSTRLTPRNALGKWFAQRVLGPKTRRGLREVTRHAEEYLRGRRAVALPRLPARPVSESALQEGLRRLRAAGQPADLLLRLETWLRESPDVELVHIRPFAVARGWNRDRWEVLGLFLQATREGLLDLSWEVLCPNCRSSREPAATSLSQLKNTSHCEVCQIKFDAQFDQSVELKFAVNCAIRARDAQTFCLAGPGGKPHVLGQLWLEAGEERSWALPQFRIPLRLRSPQVQSPLPLEPADFTPAAGRRAIRCGAAGFTADRAPAARNDGGLTIVNPNAFPIQLSLEQTDWSEDILTAARATNWQQFRDLFASEVVSPAEQVTVGSQVVLFTDLRGSTAMYHALGDARAYAVVRNHFAILAEVIRRHRGTVVKTIGDAVMATFSRVEEALEAVRDIHRQLPEANPALAPGLILKSALHVGPCLAVNANDRLDFFGTTINLAARIVECCDGGDLTVSDELFQRPETARFLRETGKTPEPSQVSFRGFDAPRCVWRIRMV